jgi:hypothetical protein
MYPLVSSDSGYYLSIARDFYNGQTYFIDIATVYNPLSILTLGSPYLFFNHPDSRLSLFINMFFLFLSAYILYLILKTISTNNKRNIFYSLFFLSGTLMLDGSHLMLETISVFFQLIGVLFYLKNKQSHSIIFMLFTGIAIALSFLSKQYGLFVLAPIGLDILINKKKIINKTIVLTLGFLIPISIFYFYLFKKGATISEFILYIFGKGLTLDAGNGTGTGYTFWTYSIGFVVFIAYNLYLLNCPRLLYSYFKQETKKNFFYLTLFPFSLLVLFLASYLHYFQYVLPYALIAFVFLTNKVLLPEKRIKNYLTFASLVLMCGISVYSFSTKNHKMILQQTAVDIVSNAVPKESKVYLLGPSPALYYLCNFNSIRSNKIGYTFPGYFYPKTIVANMETNSILILSKDWYSSYKDLTKGFQKKNITIDGEVYYILKK